jgi:spore photoproduct lyase
MQTIYIEESLLDNTRAQAILARYPRAQVIGCEHYGEVFNPKAQNFRLQKQNPALIIAQKTGKRVLPTPEGFGIGGQQNYYFSHMLNCLYDCRYCFLQGMYPSSNYLLFVNYEDFMQDISQLCAQHGPESSYFFSGYDCDSLAMEGVTQFVSNFLPFFAAHPQAILELRSKSANVRALLQHSPFKNCVVAFSFTPQAISQQVEYKVPDLSKRLQALRAVAEHGWSVGLRFDPLIYASNFKTLYSELIQHIFQYISAKHIHSVSIGPLRFPEKMFQKITKLYPQEKLLAHPLEKRQQHYSYSEEREQEMKHCVLKTLKHYIDDALIFECHSL